jgi:hypothetical protein
MRSDPNTNINAIRTASERCAQVGALCSALAIIVTAILLYFAIMTEYGEQKTVYFITSAFSLIGLCFLIGLTIYYVRKLMIKENLIKMHAKNDQIHASNMSLRRQYHSNVNEIKPNYSLNQPVPIILQSSNTNLSLNSQQKPQLSTKPVDKSYGFYQI